MVGLVLVACTAATVLGVEDRHHSGRNQHKVSKHEEGTVLQVPLSPEAGEDNKGPHQGRKGHGTKHPHRQREHTRHRGSRRGGKKGIVSR